MSDSLRLSSRAVAVSAAFVLASSAFAPAFADEGGKGGGKDRKGGKGERGAAASEGRAQGRSDGRAEGRSEGRAEGRSEGRSGGSAQGGAGGQAEDPAGNNGTFKVDGLPYDDGMANEPHVECGFRLKLFGFDDEQAGDVTIAGHAPSGSGTVASLTGVTFSDDLAGGGPNDPDAVFEFTEDDLDLSGLTAHPQQGYHLKVTLSTGEPGGVKHKVFWFEPCAEAPVVGGETVTPPAAPVPPSVPEVGGETDERGEAVLGTTFTRPDAATAARGAEVLGTRFERAPGALPFTGSVAGTLLALGGGLVVIGGGAWLAGRRPRHLA